MWQVALCSKGLVINKESATEGAVTSREGRASAIAMPSD